MFKTTSFRLLPFSFAPLAFACMLLLSGGFLTHSAHAQDGVTAKQQLFMLKELRPSVKKVGVLMAPGSAIAAEVGKAGATYGVQIVAQGVKEMSEVAPALRKLMADGVDAVWIPEASAGLSDATSRMYIIKQAVGSKIPVIAPSAEWVSQGAPVCVRKSGAGMEIVLNKATAAATALAVPEKYAAITKQM